MKTKNIFPWKFFFSTMKFQAVILTISIFSTIFVYRASFKDGLQNHIQAESKAILRTLKATLETSPVNFQNWCNEMKPSKSTAYSILDLQGNIICSTSHEVLPNHKYFHERIKVNNLQTVYLKRSVSHKVINDNIQDIDKSILSIAPFFIFALAIILTILLVNKFRPIARVLAQIEKLQKDLPFNVQLKLFYKNDEWSQFYESLKLVEENLENTLNKINDENEKTATLLESINGAVMAVDTFENIIFSNTHFNKIFSIEKSIVTDKPKLWKIFKQPEILQAFQASIRDDLPRKFSGIELQPGIFWDISINTLHNRKQENIGAVAILHDVTQAKLTEKMRVDFIANISHEIRSPLTSIKGFAQLLEAEQQKLPEDMRKYLAKILFNSERLQGLFNDLLNLSVIESQNDILFEDVELEKMMGMIKGSLQPIYQNKKLDIQYNLQVKNISVDKKLFEQALINLVDNACKYTHENTRILVSSFQEDENIIITVADQGPGISNEHHKRIFERFYRVDNARARTTGGAGLGLSIVKHIIKKHHGTIRVESELNKGTIFVITLPNQLSLKNPLQAKSSSEFIVSETITS
ncbi:MAG: GHKL domain-containing protein [Bacteriovoracaceae bacterium]|nr:GHKL domain-containing protein [Bacteriovoracaceae bacterium]